MSIKDKYNKKAVVSPKSKGNRDVINKIMHTNSNTDLQLDVNTGIQETVKREVKKATFELDSTLHKRLRTFAALNDTTMLDVVEKAIKEYLDKEEK